MLARVREIREREDQGFTLIELLVVMIIIGILAAIAIPVYLNQQKKAQDTATKSDITTVGQQVATYYVDNTAPPTLTITSGRYVLAGTDVGKASANVALAATDQHFTSATAWCVSLTNPQGDKAVAGYKYSAKNGLEEGTCVSGTDY